MCNIGLKNTLHHLHKMLQVGGSGAHLEQTSGRRERASGPLCLDISAKTCGRSLNACVDNGGEETARPKTFTV